MHKMTCQWCHNIHSGVHLRPSVYLVVFVNVSVSVRKFDEDWRMAVLLIKNVQQQSTKVISVESLPLSCPVLL